MKMELFLILAFTALFSGYRAQGFIFGRGPSGFGTMCAPLNTFCPLQCPAYEKDGHGCDICHCKGDGNSAKLTGPDHGTDYHLIQHPCIPTQRNCPIKCKTFVKGGGGCEFCMCDNSVNTNTGSTQKVTMTTQPPTTPVPTTAQPTTMGTTVSQDCVIAKQICSAKCNNAYLVDPSDCTFCICKSELSSGR